MATSHSQAHVGDPRQRLRRNDAHARAAPSTGTYGTSTNWVGFAADGPSLLHRIGGAREERLDGLGLWHPMWTLPVANASVSENVSMAEFAISAGATLTAARFGRWTDLSESRRSTAWSRSAGCTGSRSLASERRPGRQAGDGCRHRLGNNQPRGVVNPADAPLLQDTNAANGADQGSVVRRFSGAQVFASSAMTAGIALMANT